MRRISLIALMLLLAVVLVASTAMPVAATVPTTTADQPARPLVGEAPKVNQPCANVAQLHDDWSVRWPGVGIPFDKAVAQITMRDQFPCDRRQSGDQQSVRSPLLERDEQS